MARYKFYIVLYCIVFLFFSFFTLFMYFEYENDNIYPTGADPLSRMSLRSDVEDRQEFGKTSPCSC